MAGGGAGREEERVSVRRALMLRLHGDTLMLCGLSLATVISEEFPAICVQSNSLTDLGLLVNIGCWLKRTEGVL